MFFLLLAKVNKRHGESFKGAKVSPKPISNLVCLLISNARSRNCFSIPRGPERFYCCRVIPSFRGSFFLESGRDPLSEAHWRLPRIQKPPFPHNHFFPTTATHRSHPSHSIETTISILFHKLTALHPGCPLTSESPLVYFTIPSHSTPDHNASSSLPDRDSATRLQVHSHISPGVPYLSP